MPSELGDLPARRSLALGAGPAIVGRSFALSTTLYIEGLDGAVDTDNGKLNIDVFRFVFRYPTVHYTITTSTTSTTTSSPTSYSMYLLPLLDPLPRRRDLHVRLRGAAAIGRRRRREEETAKEDDMVEDEEEEEGDISVLGANGYEPKEVRSRSSSTSASSLGARSASAAGRRRGQTSDCSGRLPLLGVVPRSCRTSRRSRSRSSTRRA